MFRAKFWHSAELARKQAYINVAKSSILRAYVLASPDSAHFISLLYSIVPWRHRSKSKTRCVDDLCAQLIASDDHTFWDHHFCHHHCHHSDDHSVIIMIIDGSSPSSCSAPRWTCHRHVRQQAWAELSLPPPTEEQDDQSGSEISPLALAKDRRKSSECQRWFPRGLIPN